MRVMFIINSLGYGGAETQLVGIIPEFLERGHSVSLITLNSNLPLLSRLDKRVKVYDMGLVGLSNVFRSCFKMLRFVKMEKPDVVHSHLFQANLLSRLVKIVFPGIRVINTSHCNYNLDTRDYNPYSLYRWTSALVNYHTAVSQPALDALIENGSVKRSNCELVYNAISIGNFDFIEAKKGSIFKWIAVGRLCADKDYHNLLEAANLLRNRKVSFTLDIAGDGPMKEELIKYKEKLNLGRSVNFLGVVDNINNLLSQYNGYVISSQNEALPMAVLEAMLCGLPVVGTDVGQIGAIITTSGGGFTVIKKTPEFLADKMSELSLLSSQELSIFGQRNREYIIKNFSDNKLVEVWEQIYKKSYKQVTI